MRERKTISFFVAGVALSLYVASLSMAGRQPCPSYTLFLLLLGLLASFFGLAYFFASEKSWHAALCGLASSVGLFFNAYGLLYLMWVVGSQ